MKISFIGALLCSAALALVTTTGAFAQNKNNGIGDGKPGVLGVGDNKRVGIGTDRPGALGVKANKIIITTRSNIKRPSKAVTGENNSPVPTDRKALNNNNSGGAGDSKGFEINIRH